MNWVYIQSECSLWTVGFYDPDGRWQTDSDHNSRDEARERIHYLNGGFDLIVLTKAILLAAGLNPERDLPVVLKKFNTIKPY